MTSRFVTCRSFVALSLIMAAFSLFAVNAEARPKYKSAFEKTYPHFVRNDRKLTCALCHPGDTKKSRNHYSEALAKELGEKNVMEDDKIIEALKAIEDGDCRTGQWKPRLEKGIPPCQCGTRDIDGQSYISRQLHRAGY